MILKPFFYVYWIVLLFMLITIHVLIYIYQANGGHLNWTLLLLIDCIFIPITVFLVYITNKKE